MLRKNNHSYVLVKEYQLKPSLFKIFTKQKTLDLISLDYNKNDRQQNLLQIHQEQYCYSLKLTILFHEIDQHFTDAFRTMSLVNNKIINRKTFPAPKFIENRQPAISMQFSLSKTAICV